MHHHHHHHESDTDRIGWAFWLNFIFTIIEFIGGLLTNSVAILADAVHDLGDTLSIGLAWLFGKLGHKKSSDAFSYGYKRLSLLGALINGFVLVVGSVWVLTLSLPRILEPEMPMTQGMIALAILGILSNGFAAYKLHGGHTMNEKMLNWHLIEDVLGWIAVLVVGVVLLFVEWPILDPILSVLFTGFILFNVVKHVSQTVKLFLQGTPSEQQQAAIRQAVLAVDGVQAIHHMHFWSLDGESHVFTAHIEITQEASVSCLISVKQDVADALRPFHLAHTTVELEMSGEACRDEASVPAHGHSH